MKFKPVIHRSYNYIYNYVAKKFVGNKLSRVISGDLLVIVYLWNINLDKNYNLNIGQMYT